MKNQSEYDLIMKSTVSPLTLTMYLDVAHTYAHDNSSDRLQFHSRLLTAAYLKSSIYLCAQTRIKTQITHAHFDRT